MTPDRRLVRRLAALAEPRQRVAVLAEEADRFEAGEFVEVLVAIVTRANESRGSAEQTALTAAIEYLDSDLVSDERKLAFLAAARDGDHREVLQLMVEPKPHRVDDERHVPDYGSGRLLTLGERKSLARQPDRRVLEKVMADPHPAVIHNLLRNPKLTQGDILRLVSKRPNRDEVLYEVYRSPKWVTRYQIKVALVRNPYTPPAVSLKLLPLLLRQDLREIRMDRELHPSVLVACRRLLEGEPDDGDDSGTEGELGGPTLH